MLSIHLDLGVSFYITTTGYIIRTKHWRGSGAVHTGRGWAPGAGNTET